MPKLTEELATETKALAVEAYRDVAKQATREIGATAGAATALVLMPIRRVLEHATERMKEWFDRELKPRVDAIPPERQIEADPRISIPALQGVIQAFDDEALREMFANLLTSAADSDTASLAHPSFAEVLRQITADEARILAATFGRFQRIYIIQEPPSQGLDSFFALHKEVTNIAANCERPDRLDIYLRNLVRLGLAVRTTGGSPRSLPADVRRVLESLKEDAPRATCTMDRFNLTAYGYQFCRCCIGVPPEEADSEAVQGGP